MTSVSVQLVAATVLSCVATGCTSVPLSQSGAISSYSSLGPESGRMGKSRTYVDARSVTAARTVSITPTSISQIAASAAGNEKDAQLVANAVNRAMCTALSDRFVVVRPGRIADLRVHATVTTLVPTGKVAAGVSKVATLGTSAILPVGIPRLPWGLGGIAIEAEAVDLYGRQRAAIVWSRGANSITNSARISEVGDAYGLAGTFGKQFGRMLVTAENDSGIAFPSAQQVGSAIGARPRNAVCDDFGRSTGLVGLAGSVVGAPPSWTDSGKDL